MSVKTKQGYEEKYTKEGSVTVELLREHLKHSIDHVEATDLRKDIQKAILTASTYSQYENFWSVSGSG